MKEHVVDKHPKEHFPCTKCKSVLKTEKDLMSHFNDKHRERMSKNVTKEMQTQTPVMEQKYPCEQCDFTDKDITVLIKHRLDDHSLPI